MVEFHQILRLFNTEPNRPRASPAIFKHVGQVPYSRRFKFGERGRSKFWSILAVRSSMVEFHQILRLFNTEPNRPRASPAIFNHVGQVPYFKGLQIWGKGADQNFGPFLPTGPGWLNFIKILRLFNTQPNWPRASPAIFNHVGQVPYSRGFKFGKKGANQNFGPFWPSGPVWSNFIKFYVFLQSLIGLGPRLQFLSM